LCQAVTGGLPLPGTLAYFSHIPTNRLDLESINALSVALQRYPGTLLLVTRDHDVIDEVATRIWNFNHGRIEDFKGTYEQFLAQSEQLASPVTR
jgi:ATPase subunit of ABC transporter with duplicated ATPase domains